jgi:serine/threonine protein kinase
MNGSDSDSPRRGANEIPAKRAIPDAEPAPAARIRRDRRLERARVGTVLAGKYRVLEVLGQGGFGTVYLVEMTTGILGDKLAMKVLPHELCASEQVRAQFVNEIRVAMRMVHRHIVQIRDVGLTEDDLLYYTMDWVPGRSLRQILEHEIVLAPPRALRIVRQVLDALTVAHAASVIHRDLKPANIMVDETAGSESTKVLDFGIATVVSEEGGRQTFAGSPHYMPPEQFLGTDLGFYTDLYSVGVILYECLTGKKPYEGGSAREIFERLKKGPPEAVDQLAPEVRRYPGLAEAVMRALERNPEKRFQSAREFHEALRAAGGTADDPQSGGLSMRGAVSAGGKVPPSVTAKENGADDESTKSSERPRSRRPRRPLRRSSKSGAWLPLLIIVGVATGAAVVLLPKREDSPGSAREAEPLGVGRSAAGAQDSTPGTAGIDTTVPKDPASTENGSTGVDGDGTVRDSGSRRREDPRADPVAVSTPDAATPEERVAAQFAAAQSALAKGDHAAALAAAQRVLAIDAKHADALSIATRAALRTGDSAALTLGVERLHELRPGELTVEVVLAAAEAYSTRSSPAPDRAIALLVDLRKRFPKDVSATVALARLYRDSAVESSRTKLIELVESAHENGMRDEFLDGLFEELIAGPRRESEAAHGQRIAAALAAWSAGDPALAAERAREATRARPDAGLELLIAEAELLSRRPDEALAAIDRSRKFAAASPETPLTAYRSGLDSTSLGLWQRLLGAKSLFQRLRDLEPASAAKDERLAGTILDLEGVVDVARGLNHTELVELAGAYRLALRGYTVGALDVLENEARELGKSTNPESLFAQSLGLFHFAELRKPESPAQEDARKEEIKSETKRLKKLIDDRADILNPRDLRDVARRARELQTLERDIRALEKRIEELRALDSAAEGVRQTATAALLSARRKLIAATQGSSIPAWIERDGSFALGVVYLRHGFLADDSSLLRNATTALRRAEKAGRGGADFHATLGESYSLRSNHAEAASCYRTAFETDPQVSHCTRGVQSFIAATMRRQARELLQAGLERFPRDATLRQLEKELGK